MKIKKVLVTGEEAYLKRHQFLFKAMSLYFDLECLPTGKLFESKILNISLKILTRITALVNPDRAARLWKNERTFITRSKKTEEKIRQLEFIPDIVFHIFCQYSPFWDKFDIPYVMYLDYTMALARKNWSAWAPFTNYQQFVAWVDCERLTYKQARYIFTMSHLVKCSLVEDYGINPEKIIVVGSSGIAQEPYEEEKSFGSKQILFNGSDFERKGGDLVLAAFKQVKKVLPEAKLVIIGKKLPFREDGVDNPGRISDQDEMRSLFLNTDVIVAPAHCDPFPTFLLEAMNYGVPCIVSANDGMPEIVENGVNGIVINQLTPETLANQIMNLIEDIPKLTFMSQNARQKVKTKFNWNEIANNISQVLSTN